MATARQNQQFTEAVIATYPLDEVISWIQSNLAPDEVFDKDMLADWATAEGYIKEP